MSDTVNIRYFGLADYLPVWEQMRLYTDTRTDSCADEIWLVEHFPVYTLGQQGKREHLLNPGEIPVIQTDRGGQVTYHGPGQLVAYPLIDLKRKKLGIRELVTRLEHAMIQLLADYEIPAHARRDAPGVYVHEDKIGSLGLRVRRGSAYHGLALNVTMDLSPFSGINPCGMPKLRMTQISAFVPDIEFTQIQRQFIRHLCCSLGYNDCP